MPDPLPYLRKCRSCGKPVSRRTSADNPDLHVECGIENSAQAAIQQHRRAGPYWEKHKAAGYPPGQPADALRDSWGRYLRKDGTSAARDEHWRKRRRPSPPDV